MPNPTIFHQASRVPRSSLLFLSAMALIIVAFAPRFATRPLAEAQTTPVLSSPISPTHVGLSHTTCWVSGDLVGDAKPAVIAAVLCGD